MKTNDLSVMKWFFGVYGFIGVLLFAVGILMLFQIFPNIMSADYQIPEAICKLIK